MMTTISRRGFTLIELMVAVAIIALLAAYGLPAYQDYVIRTRVMEGLASLDGLRKAIAENAMTGLPLLQNVSDGKCMALQGPSCTAVSGQSNYSKYIKRVEISQPGTLSVRFTGSPELEDKSLLLIAKAKTSAGTTDFLSYDFSQPTPMPSGRISWTCRSADMAGPASWGRGTLPGRYSPQWCLEPPLE